MFSPTAWYSSKSAEVAIGYYSQGTSRAVERNRAK
jgi:hypothetical protein